MSSIAVVILNYNGKAHLEKFLPSVVQFSERAEIVIADNASTDDSLNFLSSSYPSLRVIPTGANLGFCGGYNYALRVVQADYYVLLNNDVEVTNGWLTKLAAILDSNPRVGAVQPKILSYHQRHLFEYAGAGGGMIDTLGYPFCRGRIFDTVEADNGQYNDTIPVFWATGACLMVRSSLYHKFNGLDEDFFAHMEEIDLCWKIKRSGSEVYYCGDSLVYHVGGGTLAAGNPRKTYYNFRNGLALLLKHLPASDLTWKFPMRVLLDWVAAVRFLFSSPSEMIAVLKAHFYVMIHLGRIFRKRRELKKLVGNYKVDGVFEGVLIVEYFIKAKKIYSDLASRPFGPE